MKETILLVDDEQGIRTVMGLSLRDAGYNVITVASGEEALQLFAERPIPIVITDIRMPGMNGLDAAREILTKDPAARILFLTTFNEKKKKKKKMKIKKEKRNKREEKTYM